MRIALFIYCLFSTCFLEAQTYWKRTGDTVVVTPYPIPKSVQNTDWKSSWEADFQKRANYVIAHSSKDGRYGNTWFENEKRSYGWAMISILAGYEQNALKFLQEKDAAAERWNKHTLGIDYYPCFTLKHQIRKLFYFGHLLAPEYKATMIKAAKIFTEKDPLRRPHYAYTGKGVWDPEGKNSWVDVRSTDNLKLMRESSVYLLAELSGNESVRKLYLERIRQYVVGLYYVGMGEWDSENYLGHSIVPLLNLYDFAKDSEAKLLAKAGLDFMATCCALKYYRGVFGGPTCRDYNHPYAFGGSAATAGWLWFGGTNQLPEEFESDEVHFITSGYRPPAAVVELAQRRFKSDLEVISSKPQWQPWDKQDGLEAKYRETLYFGNKFQLGTLQRGTQAPDINGFKLLAAANDGTAQTVIAAPCADPTKIGSPMYQDGLLAPNSAVGQNKNMAIYLTQESKLPYLWLIPKSATTTQKGHVTFISLDQVTLAIWPLNASLATDDTALSKQAQFKEKKDGSQQELWPHTKVLKSTRKGKGVYGFVVEVNEGNREAFMKAASKLQPEVDELAKRGAAAMTTVQRNRIRLQWGNTSQAIHAWRNGNELDWTGSENMLFKSLNSDVISMPWNDNGLLEIKTAGQEFHIQVSREGKVAFK